MKLPEEIPKWPQFNKETNQFLEINSNKIKVITTPNKERLEKIQSHVYSARKHQFAADRPPPEYGMYRVFTGCRFYFDQ